MTRLIDADGLKAKLNKAIEFADEHDGNYADAFKNDSQEWSAEIWTVESNIDNMPTIEAIPIEWIRNWNNSDTTEESAKRGLRVEYDLIEWMILDWIERKENEVD